MTHSHHPIANPTASSGRPTQWAYSAWPCAEASACRPMFRWKAETTSPTFKRQFHGATPGPLPETVEAAFAASRAGDSRLRPFVSNG